MATKNTYEVMVGKGQNARVESTHRTAEAARKAAERAERKYAATVEVRRVWAW